MERRDPRAGPQSVSPSQQRSRSERRTLAPNISDEPEALAPKKEFRASSNERNPDTSSSNSNSHTTFRRTPCRNFRIRESPPARCRARRQGPPPSPYRRAFAFPRPRPGHHRRPSCSERRLQERTPPPPKPEKEAGTAVRGNPCLRFSSLSSLVKSIRYDLFLQVIPTIAQIGDLL